MFASTKFCVYMCVPTICISHTNVDVLLMQQIYEIALENYPQASLSWTALNSPMPR